MVIRMIRKWLGLCEHNWEIIEEETLDITYNGRFLKTQKVFILKCQKCGKIKVEKFYV